uniref:NEL-like protein 2 n=1 Tax=Callorhinchus milii TaxID=7868 RepID=A0A4W3J3I9_CALMI
IPSELHLVDFVCFFLKKTALQMPPKMRSNIWFVLVLGFGVDPALEIDVFSALQLDDSTEGIVQVQGFDNGSKAFVFQDTVRKIKASPSAAEQVSQKLKHTHEFTVLVTLKQTPYNSGVILSIHHSDDRYLELESSGHRNEVRFHYQYWWHQSRTEVFPYALADGQWHRVALAVSASHIVLYVDCNKIYERVIERPYMDIPTGSALWLGQRNNVHGLFKGVMQDVKILVMPQGYITQCPDLNRTCPTCNDFHGLVQKIMELQDILAKTSGKLSYAEEKMNKLDQCYCEKSCKVNDVVYRESQTWTDGCRSCTCKNGTAQCKKLICPPENCSPGNAPVYVDGKCCKECQREYLTISWIPYDKSMQRVLYPSCPSLPCSSSDQISLTYSCCKVCKGNDFCAEGPNCVENSKCVNLEAGAFCQCNTGYMPLREDKAYCTDIDECAQNKHYCRENTICINSPGSYTCLCKDGYIKIDDYSCTEHDECRTGLHNCDKNALCFNTVGGHNCICKPGYTGNGTLCKAFCEDGCRNGGTCNTPNVCSCPQGFTGQLCETDIDECAEGFVQCDSRANCINLPGWYHCECRDGYHDNGLFAANGETCEDIDECATRRHSCANDTICFNLEGGYYCRCPHGKNCTDDCVYEGKIKHNGQIWVLENDRCSVCSCQKGMVMCRRMVCDCENPTVDLFCCPECDPRLTSQCLSQTGDVKYDSGSTWVQDCQQCRCVQGEVDCWPLQCPEGNCEFSTIHEGECCPRCVTDPCHANQIRNDITKTCVDELNLIRFTGSSWRKHATECTICQCKVRSVTALLPLTKR